MAQSRKQRTELEIVERLRWIFKELPEGTWTQPDPPEPDFVVESDRIIGIELTRIFKGGEELKRQESEQNEIVIRSREMYSNAHGIPVGVEIYWSTTYEPAKQQRDEIAEQVAGIVQDNIPSLGAEAELNRNYPSAILPEGIDTILIDRLIDYNLNSWSSSRGSVVLDLEPKDLQAVLDRKNAKYKHYSGRCHHLWLLIVAESNAPSGFCDIPDSTRHHKYSSLFDQVILFNYLPPQAIVLPITLVPKLR